MHIYISKKTQKMFDTDLDTAISKYSREYQLDPSLLMAFIRQESNFNHFSVRYEEHLMHAEWYNSLIPDRYRQDFLAYCSFGYMQVLYGVALAHGYVGPPMNLLAPHNSIKWGAFHVKTLLDHYEEVTDAVSTYNQGSPRRNAAGNYRNQNYVNNVMKFYEEYQAKHS